MNFNFAPKKCTYIYYTILFSTLLQMNLLIFLISYLFFIIHQIVLLHTNKVVLSPNFYRPVIK